MLMKICMVLPTAAMRGHKMPSFPYYMTWEKGGGVGVSGRGGPFIGGG